VPDYSKIIELERAPSPEIKEKRDEPHPIPVEQRRSLPFLYIFGPNLIDIFS
jgi:hypothetical protein